MTRHDLKIWPQYFKAVRSGLKTFELRKNDRDYKVGDSIYFREWNPDTSEYTGDWTRAKITYILDGPLQIPGMCLMSINQTDWRSNI